MSDDATLPGGWDRWSDEADGRTVYAYRPDVFDGSSFPAACLPVLYVTRGARTRRPGVNPNDRTADDDWFVTLYLEPDVHLRPVGRHETREAAMEDARTLASRFDAGEIDYRALYQVPREGYLDRLDELTGRDDGEPERPDGTAEGRDDRT